MNRKNIFSYLKYQKGTMALEFAIIFPVLLLLLMGIIEFGHFFWQYSALEYAISYGARYAFVYPSSSNQEIKNFVLSKFDPSESNIKLEVSNNPGVAVDITANLSYSFIALPLEPISINLKVHQALPS